MKAKEYIFSRNFNDEDCNEFGIGYLSSNTDYSNIFKTYSKEVLYNSGFFKESQYKTPYSRFFNRLMLPIRNITSSIAAFAGRSLDGSNPKYLNSAESAVFHKGYTLFNIDKAISDIEKVQTDTKNTITEKAKNIKSDIGNIEIYGLDAYNESAKIKNYIGYVPGEINFPDVKTGYIFLKNYAKSRNIKDFTLADKLISRLQLDIRAYPKRMSKGMKQKIAIVSAFMTDSPLIILDEPTTGLDPLMREVLLSILLEEKEKGKTIFISSNSIEELERVCDRVFFISQGKIINEADVNKIKNVSFRDYKIEFKKLKDYNQFKTLNYQIIRDQRQYFQVTVRVEKKNIQEMLEILKNYDVKFINEKDYSLVSYFNEERRKFNAKRK